MEAVAEPVMDMQAILLGNQKKCGQARNVEHKGTTCSLESNMFALTLGCFHQRSRKYKFD